ncbi:MAG TPA: hypothetical protein VGM88_34710 [Kofleriaceae bacterium]|jgi:hypothetical protein
MQKWLWIVIASAACGGSNTDTPDAAGSPDAAIDDDSVAIVIGGDGTGVVQLADATSGAAIGTCVASCTLHVPTGTLVQVRAATAGWFDGLDGACTASGTSNQATGGACQFTKAAAAATVRASFRTFDMLGWQLVGAANDPYLAVAFDSANDVIAAASTHLDSFSPTGEMRWTIPLSAQAIAAAPSTAIYAHVGPELVKLDPATGATVWSTPLGLALQTCELPSFRRCIVAAADGTVSLRSPTTIAGFGADGSRSYTSPDASGLAGLARLSSGLTYALSGTGDRPEGVAYDESGVQGGAPIPALCESRNAALAVTSDDQLLCASVEDNPFGTYALETYSVTGAMLSASSSDPLSAGSIPTNALATSPVGRNFWLYGRHDNATGPFDFHFEAVADFGIDPIATDAAGIPLGLQPLDLAAAPDGGAAIAGTYWSVDGPHSLLIVFRGI